MTLKDEHVANSPYDIRVDEGAWADNTGIKSYSFVVETRTRDDKPKGKGGESDNFSIEVAGPGEPEASLEDVGDGDYRVTYSLPERGTYKVAVKINGRNIKGSPFTQKND